VMLWTIGYEGLSLDEYLSRLRTAGITILCDVRRNPLSRKPGFSRKALSDACARAGIRYEHMGELGIDSAERKNLKAQADYDALFERYEREMLPRQSAAIDAIVVWIRSGESVALTCFECLAAHCHRRPVADAIARRMPAVAVQHIS
jgi:uncharacterized protein (DUF488 family)